MKFSELAQIYDELQRTKGEPQRIRILAKLFRGLDKKTLTAVAHLTVGELVPPQLSDKLGIGPGAIRAAIIAVSGSTADAIDDEVKSTGDMSEVVARLVRGSDRLSVDELWRRVNRAVVRDEDRLKLVGEIFAATAPTGAKYFTRMALNQMRIKVGTGTLARALAEAFGVEPAAVEHL